MPTKKSINQLTSLRFFAAAAIVFHHSKEAFELTRGLVSPIPLDFSVSFFFVLSGFILTYTYRAVDGRAQVLSYYAARVGRIWPVHIFSMVLVILLLPSGVWMPTALKDQSLEITLANVLLIHAWVPVSGYFFSYNAVSWSISTELFFYLAFPWLVRDWDRTRLYKSVLVVGVSLGLVLTATLVGAPVVDFQKPLTISSNGIVYISPLVRVTEFLIGIWTAKAFLRIAAHPFSGSFFWTTMEALTLGLVYLVGSVCLAVIRSSEDLDAWQIYVGASGGALAFAICIAVLAIGRGHISKILAFKPLVVLGQASFALYMTHQVFINFIFVNKATYFSRVPDTLLFVCYWLWCVGISIAIYFCVEQPSRNCIRSRLQVLIPSTSSSASSSSHAERTTP
ncbi:MAG: acyltransferase 3 [Variovorax sp.]|nr:acyltransferase 3 [Variovorax sp.]